MKKLSQLFFACLFMVQFSVAQDAVNYKTPPKEIADLLLAKPTPSVTIDSKGDWMLLLERSSYPTVEELGGPEIKVAGLRLNPNNFSPSRQAFVNNIILKNIKTGKQLNVVGLPAKLQATSVTWSPSEKKVAFLHTTETRVDAYVINLATQAATKVNTKPVNTVMGRNIAWIDDNTLLYKTTIASPTALPKKPITPKGPSVQENIGKAAPSRTYQDLIKTPYDEQVFEFMATAQLVINRNNIETSIGKPAIYSSYDVSPDKNYLLAETIKKPFSYLVPASGFATNISIIDFTGKLVANLADLPSAETRPSGNDNVQNVPRGYEWRDDEPATIIWCMPLDSGLIRNKVEYHDAVFASKAPFKENTQLFKTKMRFRGVTWGNENFALITEALTGKQTAKVSWYNPSTGTVETLFERNITDAYNNPGSPVLTKNKFGRNVIWLNNFNEMLLNNTTGSSPKGDLPFLARFNYVSKQTEIIWRCAEKQFEYVVDVIDPSVFTVITRKESQKEVPNYYLKNLKGSFNDVALTSFSNPYKILEGITKQKVKYQRADGIELTGDLYLPAGYNKDRDGTLPVFMWAYPREFNSAADAGQVRGSEYKFTTISWGSPLFYVTQGFAVLDNAEMPIASMSTDKKPNDNFIEQLKMNAEAAINFLVGEGIGNRNKFAVGGHSYGAFMTANLLAHTNLFKAGIARSGAYNRTLTPFGFQNEDRTYWQAPKLYYEMSPFSYADKIKTPILLVHGEQDDNPGTFPINSERLFNAIKGHGGTVRYVSLPYEAHSYRGKENLLHMLAEQGEWLNKFVKEAKD